MTWIFRLVAFVAGDSQTGERLLGPIRKIRAPLVDGIRAMPYTKVQNMLDPGVPPGYRNYWKSHYLAGLPDEAVERAFQHANGIGALRSQVLISYMKPSGGQVFPDTALSHRDAPWILNINAMWERADQDQDEIGWSQRYFDAMRPYSTGGVYVNFLGSEGDTRVRAAYDPGKYERLIALKHQYDPTNFFRLNQNIRPSR